MLDVAIFELLSPLPELSLMLLLPSKVPAAAMTETEYCLVQKDFFSVCLKGRKRRCCPSPVLSERGVCSSRFWRKAGGHKVEGMKGCQNQTLWHFGILLKGNAPCLPAPSERGRAFGGHGCPLSGCQGWSISITVSLNWPWTKGLEELVVSLIA